MHFIDNRQQRSSSVREDPDGVEEGESSSSISASLLACCVEKAGLKSMTIAGAGLKRMTILGAGERWPQCSFRRARTVRPIRETALSFNSSDCHKLTLSKPVGAGGRGKKIPPAFCHHHPSPVSLLKRSITSPASCKGQKPHHGELSQRFDDWPDCRASISRIPFLASS